MNTTSTRPQSDDYDDGMDGPGPDSLSGSEPRDGVTIDVMPDAEGTDMDRGDAQAVDGDADERTETAQDDVLGGDDTGAATTGAQTGPETSGTSGPGGTGGGSTGGSGPAAEFGPASDDSGNLFVRLLFMVGFGALAWMLFGVILFLALLQFIVAVLNKELNQDLRGFTRQLIVYLTDLLAYVTFLKEDKPFPLGKFPKE